jgi:hypothetical protein
MRKPKIGDVVRGWVNPFDTRYGRLVAQDDVHPESGVGTATIAVYDHKLGVETLSAVAKESMVLVALAASNPETEDTPTLLMDETGAAIELNGDVHTFLGFEKHSTGWNVSLQTADADGSRAHYDTEPISAEKVRAFAEHLQELTDDE